MEISAKRILVATYATACVAISMPANATVTYNSAGNFSISSVVNDNVFIDNTDAIVTLQSNGRVRGVDTSTPVLREAAARLQRGTLNLTDSARLIAGLNQSVIELTSLSRSDVHVGGHAVVHGNITSDASASWYSEANAAQRVYVEGDGLVSGSVIFGSYIRVQDRSVVTGTISSTFATDIFVEITGGSIGANVTTGGTDDHTIKMSGGTIFGKIGGEPSRVDLDLSGGYIGQGLRSRGAYNGIIRGGFIDGGIALTNEVAGNSQLSIRGGNFETVAGDWLVSMTKVSNPGFATLSICGGQFGYFKAGNGLYLNGRTNLALYGNGLALTAGRVTGTLQDGSPIDVAVTFGPSFSGSFTLNNVIAPPTC